MRRRRGEPDPQPCQDGEDAPRTLITFEIGEQVKVTDGPFEGFDGMVEEVDEDNQRLKVTVSIFGRATPVELEFTQVRRASEASGAVIRPEGRPTWEARGARATGPDHARKARRTRPARA